MNKMSVVTIATTFFSCTLINVTLACCSSPLAETVFEAVIDEVAVYKELEGYGSYEVVLRKTKNIHGESPDSLKLLVYESDIRRYYGVQVQKGKSYLVTIFDYGKHDRDLYPIGKERWRDPRLLLHPHIGLLDSDGFKANLVLKNLEYFGDLSWTADFKAMQVYFRETD